MTARLDAMLEESGASVAIERLMDDRPGEVQPNPTHPAQRSGRAVASIETAHGWPDLDKTALHGVAGDFVRLVEPHPEADPVALLVQFLVSFGNLVGREPHYVVESDRHPLNEFVALIGQTGKGRKGTSFGRVRRGCRPVDQAWESDRIVSGLSSGEGLIYHVRDGVQRYQAGETVTVDEGVPDKRMLVEEPEFASLLRVMGREGNTLSPVLRRAWDGDTLRSLSKNSPLKSTGAHVSLVAHVTVEELRQYLTRTEMGNGFANRFLWICVKRSKELPDGGNLNELDLGPILTRLSSAVERGRKMGELRRDEGARGIWREVYGALSADRRGLFGAVVGRAEAHVVRLSSLYAVLDESEIIRPAHMLPALAVWDYAEASALHVFGDSTGHPDADTIVRALRSSGDGMSRTELHALFGRHRSEAQLDRALEVVRSRGLGLRETVETDGRPMERWVVR